MPTTKKNPPPQKPAARTSRRGQPLDPAVAPELVLVHPRAAEKRAAVLARLVLPFLMLLIVDNQLERDAVVLGVLSALLDVELLQATPLVERNRHQRNGEVVAGVAPLTREVDHRIRHFANLYPHTKFARHDRRRS